MRINKMDNTLNFNAGMGGLSKALYTLSNNDMLNASFVDVFAMDTPRTIVETKNRGKQAGIEMGFREYTGTFIAEFSAALFAVIASKFISKKLTPDVKVNSGSWITNNGLDVFSDIYNKSDKTPKSYVENILNSMSGLNGKETKEFSKIDKDKTNPIVEKLTNLITDNKIDKKESKKVLNKVQDEIINLLGADNNIKIKGTKDSVSSNLSHALRDIVEIDCIVLDVVRNIIKGNVEKNLMPNFSKGLVDFKHLYNTIGFTGIYETMKRFGYVR